MRAQCGLRAGRDVQVGTSAKIPRRPQIPRCPHQTLQEDLALDVRSEEVPGEPADWNIEGTAPPWTIERVSFTTVYGDERMSAFLLLPDSRSPPYQPLVHFPGEGAMTQRDPFAVRTLLGPIDFFVRTGRSCGFCLRIASTPIGARPLSTTRRAV